MLNRLARCRVKSFFHAPRAAEPMAGYPGEQLRPFDVLLGMDVISTGKLEIDKSGHFSFTF
jgi:hypothetical protein